MLNTHRCTAWTEVDLDAIRHNFRNLLKAAAPAKVLAVVKSEGYGHGLEAAALTADEEGAWGFAIVSVSEGRRLRNIGITKPIILIAPILPSHIEDAVKLDLRPPIIDAEFAKTVSDTAVRLGKTAKVHLKVDTGMGRLSSAPEEVIKVAAQLIKLPNLEVEGLYSHFAAADCLDQSYTQMQLERFLECSDALKEMGFKIPFRHISASSGIMLLDNAKFELTRAGIAMYGQWPSEEVRLIMAGREKTLYYLSNSQVSQDKAQARHGASCFAENPAVDFLRPALSFKTIVSQVKTMASGESISYGHTFTCHRTSTIAVLPLGYADGLSRGLSNCGEVLIKGYRAPIAGRICMNLCMVDVTDIPGVRPGDEAVIIGRQGKECITASEVAAKLHTINYEVITSIPMHIPRFYLGRRPEKLDEILEARKAAQNQGR